MGLRVPQDRAGRFSIEVFKQSERSRAALVQMYVSGVWARRVRGLTEELCGHQFSAGGIRAIAARLDEELRPFAQQPLGEEFPYVILDVRL